MVKRKLARAISIWQRILFNIWKMLFCLVHIEKLTRKLEKTVLADNRAHLDLNKFIQRYKLVFSALYENFCYVKQGDILSNNILASLQHAKQLKYYIKHSCTNSAEKPLICYYISSFLMIVLVVLHRNETGTLTSTNSIMNFQLFSEMRGRECADSPGSPSFFLFL